MVAKILPTMLLGAGSLAGFYYLFLFAVNDFLRPTEKMCFAGVPQPNRDGVYWHETGIAGVDNFACFISAFFGAIISSPSGLFILRQFCGLTFPVFTLMAFESQRMRARGVVTWLPFIAFLCVGVAFGVMFPLVWVVGYWWMPKSSKGTHIGDSKIGAIFAYVFAIIVSYVAFCLPSVRITHRPWLVPVVLLPVLLSPLVYLAPHGEVADLAKPVTNMTLRSPRVHAFGVVAGVSAVFHFWALLDFASTPHVSLLPALLNAGPQWHPEHFLLVDITMCWLGCAFFVLLEEGSAGGLHGLLEFVGVTLVLGPGGSFALCCLAREVGLMVQEVAEVGKRE